MLEFTGDIFIVPNGLTNSDELKKMNFTSAEELMFDKYPNELFVEVWMTNGTNKNWYDHGYEVRHARLPVSMFTEKKEGDTVTFETETSSWQNRKIVTPVPCAVTLTIAQGKYRYRQFGDFDKLLKNLKLNAMARGI